MNMSDLIKSAGGDKGQRSATRLQVGDIVDLSDNPQEPRVHLVFRVNECRACLLPMTGAGQVEATDKNVVITDYNVHPKMFGISPNTEATILKRLGKAGMIQFLESQQTNKQQRKESNDNMSKKSANKTEEAAPKLGALGGFLGHSLTSVIRAMGKLGWEYWEAAHVFAAEKIPVAENTIRIQLAAGRRGQGGEPAPIAAELKKLRPDASEKPARKSNNGDKKGKGKGKGKSSKPETKSKKDKSSKKQAEPEEAEVEEPETEEADAE